MIQQRSCIYNSVSEATQYERSYATAIWTPVYAQVGRELHRNIIDNMA